MNPRLVEIYPVEGMETQLPVKEIQYGEGTMFVVNLSDEEINTHFEEIASVAVEQRDDGIYEANIQLGVWRESGEASTLEKQVVMSIMTKKPEGGERVYVVDPWYGYLCNAQKDDLLKFANENPGLLGVMTALGGNLLVQEFKLDPQRFAQGPIGVYNGYREISPQKFPIGLSYCADTKAGTLDYTVLLMPNS